MTRVLSLQTPLLGNRPFGEVLRRKLASSDTIELRALWADEARIANERTPSGRVAYRLFFTHARNRYVRERNADFYAMRYELGTSFWAHRLLTRELPAFAPAVLHIHTQGSALLSRDVMRRIPTVISADMTSRLTAEQFTRPGWHWTHAVHNAIEGAAFREAAALVAFSHYVARSMIDDYGVDPRKVFVIPPGVDLESFGDPGADRASRDDGVRRILFVGGEFERKGGPILVAAFLRAFGDRPDVELHLVTGASASVPRHPRIIVHAAIAPYTPQWRALYERASLVAMPSLREAFGHVYLEAGAARLPIIASSVGAGPELVSDGETGFLLEPGDEATLVSRLRALVDDPALALRLGAAGRARVEHSFDAAHNAERMARVFVDVARER